jgi:hypothetical protein
MEMGIPCLPFGNTRRPPWKSGSNSSVTMFGWWHGK